MSFSACLILKDILDFSIMFCLGMNSNFVWVLPLVKCAFKIEQNIIILSRNVKLVADILLNLSMIIDINYT